jgi:Lon protease-like protein
MQAYGLSLVEGPAAEPVTVEECRAHLRIGESEGSGDEYDDLISAWITMAREYAEEYTGRRFGTDQVWRMTLDDWPDERYASIDVEARVEQLTGRVRRACALAIELGDAGPDPSSDIADDAVLGSYQLVALTPLGPDDSQRLLAAPGPVARLDLLDDLLDDVEAMLHFRLGNDDDESDDGSM